METKGYKRKIYIVDKKFQYKFVLMLLFFILITVFTVSFTTFYVIWQNVIEEFFFVPEASKKLGDIYIKTTELLILPLIVLSVVSCIAGILISHRIAGPVYRMKKVAEEIAKGNLCVSVKFRKSDELHGLADSMNAMIAGVRNLVKEDRNTINKIMAVSDKLTKDIKKHKGLKAEVKKTINELNSIIKTLKKNSGRFKTE
ncbi:MAG: methyl-accepting chemotaxis protein [Candidatus Goldbacteria bacterium]|nr:methyl-accepting chemotaxis protein [Candidatus Goldiibacteriota bacterium]